MNDQTNTTAQPQQQETNALQNKRPASPTQVLGNMLAGKAVKQLFENALGNNAGAFTASLLEVFSNDKALQACQPADIIKEAQKAASLNLPINKSLGFAYIIPYKGKPSFQIGYKGLIQLALRTGYYKNINADVVYEGELGQKNKLTGEIDLTGTKKSDKVIGYFAYIEFLNGFSKTLYMTVEEMAKHAVTYSKGNKHPEDKLIARAGKPSLSGSVGWFGAFDEMAKKTALRLLIGKYGYLSVELQTAVASEAEQDYRNADNAGTKIEEAEYSEVISFEDEQTTEDQDAVTDPAEDTEDGTPKMAF